MTRQQLLSVDGPVYHLELWKENHSTGDQLYLEYQDENGKRHGAIIHSEKVDTSGDTKS